MSEDMNNTEQPPIEDSPNLKRTLSEMNEGEPSKTQPPSDGLGPDLSISIQQGLSTDQTSLRANDRTAKMLVQATHSSADVAEAVGNLLQGVAPKAEGAFARVCFELLYPDGEKVELINHNKHSEHIDVAEPNGSAHTKRKLSESIFSMDSRASRDKRVAHVRSFYSAVYLDTKVDGDRIDFEAKFSTNITSRQHDRSNFVWRATLEYSLDGVTTMAGTADTNEFEYVARRLKTKPAPRKRPASDYVRPPRPQQGLFGTPSPDDSDDDAIGVGTCPMAPAPAPIRRSSRKAAAVCREGLTKIINEEPAGEAGDAAVRQLNVQRHERTLFQSPEPMPSRERSMGGLNACAQVQSMAMEEDEYLRKPSRFGQNLSRTESIDRLFDAPRNTEYVERTILGRCESEEDFHASGEPTNNLNPLALQKVDSTLALQRCASSTFSLFSVGDDDLEMLDEQEEDPFPDQGHVAPLVMA